MMVSKRIVKRTEKGISMQEAEGLTDREVAERLGIALSTWKTQKSFYRRMKEGSAEFSALDQVSKIAKELLPLLVGVAVAENPDVIEQKLQDVVDMVIENSTLSGAAFIIVSTLKYKVIPWLRAHPEERQLIVEFMPLLAPLAGIAALVPLLLWAAEKIANSELLAAIKESLGWTTEYLADLSGGAQKVVQGDTFQAVREHERLLDSSYTLSGCNYQTVATIQSFAYWIGRRKMFEVAFLSTEDRIAKWIAEEAEPKLKEANKVKGAISRDTIEYWDDVYSLSSGKWHAKRASDFLVVSSCD